MALLIRLDAVYGPGRVPEATGTGTSCPVRLGSPTGDSRREVEPPGRRLRAASAAPARRDFIRHIELAARGRAATYRAFPSVLAPSAVRSRSILGGTSEGGGLVKVFVTLLTGIQGQRERLRGKSGFFKTAATARGSPNRYKKSDGIVVITVDDNSVRLLVAIDALPPLQPPPRAGF